MTQIDPALADYDEEVIYYCQLYNHTDLTADAVHFALH